MNISTTLAVLMRRSVLLFGMKISTTLASRIVMRCLTTGIRSEQCVFRRFRRCSNVIECTFTKTMVSIVILYYNIIILWDHRRMSGPSLTETSLCGAWLYYAACYCSVWKYGLPVAHIRRRTAILRHENTNSVSSPHTTQPCYCSAWTYRLRLSYMPCGMLGLSVNISAILVAY
jgi:hypothetical protein